MAPESRVMELEVLRVPTPSRTPTYSPLSYGDLINRLRDEVYRLGLDIVGREYSLAREGRQLFGVWEIQDGAVRGAIGFRTSHDKSLSLGLTAGSKVMVCSNLAFDGEWIEFRKHTAGLGHARVTEMFHRAVGMIMDKIAFFMKWQERLHDYDLTAAASRLMTFCAIEKGILPARDIHKMIEMVHNPETSRYEASMQGWHGGATECLRDRNLVHVQSEHQELTSLINEYILRRNRRA